MMNALSLKGSFVGCISELISVVKVATKSVSNLVVHFTKIAMKVIYPFLTYVWWSVLMVGLIMAKPVGGRGILGLEFFHGI